MGSSKSEKTTERKTVSYWALFRYATPLDHLLMFISVIACAVKAIVYPAGIVIYSEMVSMLVDRHLGVGTSSPTLALPLFGGGRMLTNATYEESMVALREDSWASGIWMGILAIVLFVSGIIHVDILNWTGLRITIQLRKRFFQATIRKDVGWHDITANQNFAVRITDNIEKVRDGISEKLGHFVNVAAGGIFIIILSFIYGWKLTLVIIVYIPIMLFCNYIVAKYNSKLTIREQDSYVNAGSLVEEVIGGVRTVVAFGGEKSEMDRYDQLLVPALNASKRKGAFSGVAETLTRAMPFITAAATFWYGISLLLEDRYNDDKDYTPAVLMIVFFGTLISADHIARCAPYFDAFTAAVGSIVPIYEVIDSPTKIDPLSTDGKILNNGLKGDLEFQDVFFTYPSRDDATVLRGLSITIKAGETVALVGHSGCGKSTCLQLIQRFYDPMFGNILADGLDVRKYNVSWLRSNMAVVGQEPVLFQGTIGENIRHGKPNATQKEAEDAARAAGAHDFIINLPESYDTFLSEKGLQLSGGQKQRIAIARALIHNPKILLLDEATSALDYQSEKLVQNALNAASKGRTTIVVSHRLSAIKDADRIIFIHEGKAIEEGAHNELMQLRGKYYEMITSHGQDESDTNEKEDPKKEHILESPVDHENNVLEKNFLKNNSYQEFTMTTKKDDEKKKKDDGEETQFFKAFIKILKIARQEWCYLAIGTICAILYGCTQPAFAFIIGEFYAALAQPEEDVVRQRVSILAIISLIVGIIVGTVCYTQTYFFNIAGVWLTTKIRSAMFKAILSQEIGWFDEKENSIGSLSARLSGDAASVQGAIGYPLSGIIQALANLFCCITMAFYFSWQIALACLCTAPIMVGSIVLEAKFMARSAILEKRILEETSSLATEAISNIRTVAALRREEQLIVDYNKEVDRYGSQLMKRQRFRGVVNSSGWSLMYLGYAVSLTYGGILCSEGKIEFQNIIKVTESLLYGLMILAMALAFLPTFTSALISGHRLFRIIERKPKIGPPSHYDNKSMVETSSKAVLYDNVSFRYPTRPDVQVLGGLNLKVLQGKTVALVGSSGCGKSTCIQLLLRYYDPEAGHITLDGEDIQRDLPLVTLRRRLGIVSQEPVLFERTIAENIAYGDNSRTVPMDEIIEAAKMANAYSFVTALPSGFETKLGARGTQLSGGQKQRIAIARALVRNPQILLLDEATSALDLQSERVVQSALDSACSGRTCIIVAHRLSTIQNADIICVLQNGRIVERGNHSQLIAKDGIYARLYKSQPVG